MKIRKSTSAMTSVEKTKFKNAVNSLLADPSNPYGKLVAIHGNMMHNQHGMNAVGTQRFLPWHRVYLLRFEEAIQSKDPTCFLPYWDWTSTASVPTWIRTLKPTVFIPGAGSIIVKRNNSIPAKKNVSMIMKNTDYTSFTDALENGPHGEVHMEIGVVKGVREAMSRIAVSPSDPLFWLHHAQLDRLWSQWQVANPGKNPSLVKADAIFDPWTEKLPEVLSVASLGYQYA